MDPEMIKLLAAAKAGNKNLSGTLNNLDNPLYTLIAGVYDPLAAQGGAAGGGGPLWSQYAGDTNPIMRDLMMKIQNGTNKFYLGSYIDSLKPEDVQATGYSPSDLKGLASGLLKEYTDGASSSSGNSKDTLAKAGYRNPTDLYSTSDMPIGKQGAAGLTKISKEQVGIQKAVDATKLATIKAMSGLGPLFNGFDAAGRAKSPSVDQMMNYISNNENFKSQIPKGDMRQVDPATGDIYQSHGTQQHRSYGTFDPRNLLNIIDIPLQEGFRTLEQLGSQIKGQQTPNIENILAGQMPTEKAVSKVKKAKRQEGLALGQSNASAAETELYKKGMMRALAETGRTPLGDQIKTMLKFAAQVK